MKFQWVQFTTKRGEPQHWALVYKNTREVVMDVRMPMSVKEKDAGWFRQKCLILYSWLYEKALYNQLTSFKR